MTDLTERRDLELQLIESQKMESVGRLAGGVAHDFNNLLSVILGVVDLALPRLNEDHPLRNDLQDVRQAAQRAANLTRQLLAFSRRQVLYPRVLDLNTVVEEMLSMLQRLIGEDIDVRFVPSPELPNVRADPGQIEQVLANLVLNARDAMPYGGMLTIETRLVELDETYARQHEDVQAGPHVMLALSDTGIGMDEATRDRIFEPFFTTKSPGQGTGLGLATVYGIVRQSGGALAVYSEPGQGSTFRIYLPPTASSEVRSNAPAPAAGTIGTETVLLVEDDAAVRVLATRILRAAGYTVLPASAGHEALALLETQQSSVDLLLTDVVMPGMSGDQLAKQVAERKPGLPVLYTSGYTDEAIVSHGVLSDGACFLGKPYSVDDLRGKVRQVLDAPNARRGG